MIDKVIDKVILEKGVPMRTTVETAFRPKIFLLPPTASLFQLGSQTTPQLPLPEDLTGSFEGRPRLEIVDQTEGQIEGQTEDSIEALRLSEDLKEFQTEAWALISPPPSDPALIQTPAPVPAKPRAPDLAPTCLCWERREGWVRTETMTVVVRRLAGTPWPLMDNFDTDGPHLLRRRLCCPCL